MVFANITSSNPGVNQACLGDENGAFTCSDVSGAVGDYSGVKFGLVNDDNILDVIFAGFSAFTRICDGTFSNCSNDTSLPFGDIELGEFGQALPSDLIFTNGFE